jgi:hypothetical protein
MDDRLKQFYEYVQAEKDGKLERLKVSKSESGKTRQQEGGQVGGLPMFGGKKQVN